MSSKRLRSFVTGLASLTMLVLFTSACSDGEVIRETVIVERTVESTVVVPQEIEKIVVATPTPAPTATALPPLSRTSMVRIAQSDTALGLNPGQGTWHPFRNTNAGQFSYNRLTNLTGSFEPVAQLAESWSSNSTATEWTFELREGAKFHDGSELDAEDVVYSYRYMLDPENGSPGASQFTRFMDAESFTVIDSSSVKLTLDQPSAEIPLLIHSKEIAIVPAGSTFESLRLASNGTGPYVVPQFDPNSQVLVLDKNPSYWEPGKPRTDHIEFFGIPDDTARMAALRTGEVDLITGTGGAVKAAQINAARNMEGVDLLISENPAISLELYMEIDSPPFDDVKVRTALKMVADRRFIAETVLDGLAFPGNDTPIPPFWDVAYKSTPTEQDIEEAKRLLAEAGYDDDNPLKLQLHVADIHAGALEMAQAYQNMALEAGVDIELITIPATRYWDTSWLNNGFGISAWGIRPPGQALSIAYTCDSQWPETRWCRADYDALLSEAEATLDPVVRANLYKEAQRLLDEEGGLINLLFTKPVDAIRSTCSGYQPPIPFYQRDFTMIECLAR